MPYTHGVAMLYPWCSYGLATHGAAMAYTHGVSHSYTHG